MTIPIILASGSPVRARLLQDAGVSFEVQSPRVDESTLRDSLLAEGQPHRNVADGLAELKAVKVSGKVPDRMVIGADQVLSFDGKLFSKARDRAEAKAILHQLSGQTHDLISAVVIAEEGRPVWRHVETVSLTLRSLSARYIDAYLDLVWPDVAGCVGCYKLEGEGIRLFARIRGDFHAGLGLPLLPVLSYLATRGKLDQ